MKKLYFALALIGLGVGWYAFFNSYNEHHENTLIVGTSADYPPFEYLENNVITGFEIDLIKNIAGRLAKPIIIKDLPFDILLNEIQLGKIHVIAGALTETPERAKQVLFTPSYMDSDTLLLVSTLDNPIEDVTKLVNTDKKVLVNEGYTSDLYASNIKGLNLIRLKNPTEAFLALNNKKADAFIIAQNMAEPFFKKYSRENYNIKPIEGVQDAYSLAISKNMPELLAPIAAALENMKKDGTLKELKEKWHIS